MQSIIYHVTVHYRPIVLYTTPCSKKQTSKLLAVTLSTSNQF